MTVLKVQTYLKNKSFEDLSKDKAILIKYYNDYVVLNYSYKTPYFDEIGKECRGLILDRHNLQVLCRSFDRFYNYQEVPLEALPSQNEISLVLKKYDGVLIRLWFNPYKEKWDIATRGTAHAEPIIDKNLYKDKTYSELVSEILTNFPSIPSSLNSKNTYTFELLFPNTFLTTSTKETELILLNIRENNTGVEAPFSKLLEFNKQTKIKVPEVNQITSLNSLQNTLESFPEEMEGFVIIWENEEGYQRLKVKNKQWVQLSLLKREYYSSSKAILSNIKNQKELPIKLQDNLPVKNLYKEYQEYFIRMITDIQQNYQNILETTRSYSKKEVIYYIDNFVKQLPKHKRFFKYIFITMKYKNQSIKEAFKSEQYKEASFRKHFLEYYKEEGK